MSDENETRHYLCVTCGTLQPAHLFAVGDCTCKHCNDEGRNGVNWHKANDGEGFVAHAE